MENRDASHSNAKVLPIQGMYEEYFLDYASYVILERAIPMINDGLKPVQRRILYSLKEKDDGRYHKVANIIGHTMQYHPHGDAAIGDAMVKLGQKDLTIDTQGNWGDMRTGDSAAAARYIECRLTKFALEVAFNKQTTNWQMSYDGRNNEPLSLPMKFPLLLAQGAEGIAVGLSTKILPHNFNELIKASIKILQNKKVKIYPDFITGGSIDVSDYNGGKRGGSVKVRAKIEILDKKSLSICELPYGVTTTSLIDSILKSNDKGQINIKKITDNTAKTIDIRIELSPGTSPEVTIDALYAFTSCQVSISPNACVIIDQKPHFIRVEDILKFSTEQTKDLLKLELQIKLGELEDKMHHASLEKIFIENRIYRKIEEAESFEEALEIIHEGLKQYISTPSDNGKSEKGKIVLNRDITQEDLIKLSELKIRRISKYNKFKHEELMLNLKNSIDEVNHHLNNIIDFSIAYFEMLLDKFGKGKERRTEIANFETIKAQTVVANNTKLYVNRKEGFIGWGIKKDEFVTNCSDLDEIIAIRKNGKFQVSKIGDKVFMGKDIIHVDVWKKGDDRTTYNLIYSSGQSGISRVKRFNVKAITRDKEYDLTKGEKGSKILYLTSNPNGESELVQILLSPGCSAKNKKFEYDFSELTIKGRTSQGNILTKYPIKKVTQLKVGKSSLGAIDLWIDESSGRVNKDERGQFIGSFDTGELILVGYANGNYLIKSPEVDEKIDVNGMIFISKYKKQDVISVLYFEGVKKWLMIKRFQIETNKLDQKFKFVSEHVSSKVYFMTTNESVEINYSYKEGGKKQQKNIVLTDFVDVKGWKALGNKVAEHKVLSVKVVNEGKKIENSVGKIPKGDDETFKPGDSLELDF